MTRRTLRGERDTVLMIGWDTILISFHVCLWLKFFSPFSRWGCEFSFWNCWHVFHWEARWEIKKTLYQDYFEILCYTKPDTTEVKIFSFFFSPLLYCKGRWLAFFFVWRSFKESFSIYTTIWLVVENEKSTKAADVFTSNVLKTYIYSWIHLSFWLFTLIRSR